MGTNYYLGDTGLHIGKTSAGWTFHWRGYREPVDGADLSSAEGWSALLRTTRHRVVDEYGDTEDPADFLARIEERNRTAPLSMGSDDAGWRDGRNISWLDHAARAGETVKQPDRSVITFAEFS